eukprot:2036954-Rhodomonas_salina.1
MEDLDADDQVLINWKQLADKIPAETVMTISYVREWWRGQREPAWECEQQHCTRYKVSVRLTQPCGQNTEEKERRRQLFEAWDANGNGFLSLAELDKGIRQTPFLLASLCMLRHCTRYTAHNAANQTISISSASVGSPRVEHAVGASRPEGWRHSTGASQP